MAAGGSSRYMRSLLASLPKSVHPSQCAPVSEPLSVHPGPATELGGRQY